MMADELLNAQDLVTAKKHDTFHSEVITGKAGGLSTGANIDYATNAVTGQVQKTLPATVNGIDWSPVGNLTTDNCTFTKATDYAVDDNGTQWAYNGTFPFTSTAPVVPSAPDYYVVHVKSASAISNANGGSVQDFIDGFFDSVQQMVAYENPVVGSKYRTGAGVWRVVSNEVGLPISGGLYAIPLNGAWLGDFGVDTSGSIDSVASINDAFTKADLYAWTVVGQGTMLVGSTVNLKSKYNGNFSAFKATPSFTTGTVVDVVANNSRAKEFYIRPNIGINADAVGIRISGYNFKGEGIDARLFDYGCAVNSFSCTLTNCVFTQNNTNLTAYAPDPQHEINALNILGGEYFGATDYALNIGDARFASTIPTTSNQGNMVKIIGITTDQSCIRLDRVSNVEISCYFEGGDSSEQDAYIQIDNTYNTMNGVSIHDCNCNNSGGTMDYLVRCLNAVKGLRVDNFQYTAIPKCAVYSPNQDIYPVYIGTLMPTSSHTLAPQIHLGVRNGQAANALSSHTVLGDIDGGVPALNSAKRVANVKYEEINETANYIGEGWVSKVLVPSTPCTVVAANAVQLQFQSPLKDFSAGMYVDIGGIKTSITNINYETQVISVQSFALTNQTTIKSADVVKRSEFYTFQAPTATTGLALGSIGFNNFTVDQTRYAWVLKAAGWSPL